MPIEKHSITASWWEYSKTDIDGMVVCKGRNVLFIWLFVWSSPSPPLPSPKKNTGKFKKMQKSSS